MPVVVVIAPSLPPEEQARALSAVAAAVAGALSLRPDDVVVTTVHAAGTVIGQEAIDSWPVVLLHGGPRDPGAMVAAEEAARDRVSAHWSVPADRVWTQWQVR
jgi:hypothetical protein